jgi:hypothetical protein
MHDASDWFSITYKKLSKKVAEKLDKRLPIPVCLPCNHSQTINTHTMTNTHTLRPASEIFNAEVRFYIESSNDIPRLEGIVRDCNRARRHSLRAVKWGHAENPAAATARAEAFQAMAACAAARLESFND